MHGHSREAVQAHVVLQCIAVRCSALQCVAVASHINTYTYNAHICIYMHVCVVCVCV